MWIEVEGDRLAMTEKEMISNFDEGRNHRTLSEFESARMLADFGIPTANGILAKNLEEVRKAAKEIGYPVVLKICSPVVSHKIENGLVAVDLRNEADLELAFHRISASSPAKGGGFLVQEMIKGWRELVIGMIRDPQFGPCVMFGLGGILTEILGDVTFRPVPLCEADANEMLREIKGKRILDAIRGMPAVDAGLLIQCLMAVGRIGLEREEIQAVDVNPLIVQGSRPVAVDALVVLM
jgi:succinyl-CoA synthetase beta subunit